MLGSQQGRPAPDLLPRYLAAAWAVLTLYGSLYPFAGWQTVGIDPFAFLTLPWPRYWTAFDLIANVVIYLPLGFFATLSLLRLPGRWTAPLLGTLLAALLSFSMESLQAWLPARISSNVDLGCNSLGGLLGSLLAAWIGPQLQPFWKSWRPRLIAPLPHVDLGLTLLGLWLLTLLSPENLLFGTGDLRLLLGGLPTLSYAPETYRFAETAVVASNFLALGLFAGAMTQGRWLAYLLVPLFFLVAALVRSLESALLAGPGRFLDWLTPGVEQGLQLGAVALGILLLLPPLGRLMLAALALLAGVILVNLAPLDPYSPTALTLWHRGHFLNFSGLIRWVATIWPFLTLPYLVLVSRRI
ncbi:MAG: VanZ family protein [Azovibrio sp.]|uniref:VanZ family protein n=1 Tax=Azovibrio sp. TaxID=1872673 RepID=UPI003C724B39